MDRRKGCQTILVAGTGLPEHLLAASWFHSREPLVVGRDPSGQTREQSPSAHTDASRCDTSLLGWTRAKSGQQQEAQASGAGQRGEEALHAALGTAAAHRAWAALPESPAPGTAAPPQGLGRSEQWLCPESDFTRWVCELWQDSGWREQTQTFLPCSVSMLEGAGWAWPLSAC